ncbi:hypothetical protein [Haliea salexigens]|uniref:hypothetical protein n=1 Tax=Haliea salexigens TaxID=287487 RepID=UPI000420AA68|nr:hypothetical protein [Haliea salexigens]
MSAARERHMETLRNSILFQKRQPFTIAQASGAIKSSCSTAMNALQELVREGEVVVVPKEKITAKQTYLARPTTVSPLRDPWRKNWDIPDCSPRYY